MSWEKLSIAVIVVVLIVVGIVAFQIFTSQEPVKIESVEKTNPKKAEETEPVTEIAGEANPLEEQGSGLARQKVAPTKTRDSEGLAYGGVYGRVLNKKKQPVEGARVVLCTGGGLFMSFPSARNELGIEDVTDSQGRFRLSGLVPGRQYAVVAIHPDYADTTRSPISVSSNGDVELADIIMNAGLVVKGLVTNDSGVPLAGAEVSLLDPTGGGLFRMEDNKVLKKTKTDSAGRYVLNNISTQTFEVLVSAEGYATQSKRNMQFDVKRVNEIDFKLGPAMAISGFVSDNRKQPLAGATIRAFKTRAKNYSSSGKAVSLEDGSFTVEGIANGTYVIRVTCDGYSPVARQRVKAGDTNVSVKLLKQGGVAGTVRDRTSGKPITAFTVTLYRHRPGKPRFRTGISKGFQSADGAYSLDNIDPGTYVIEIGAAGYAKSSSDPFLVSRGAIKEGVDVFMTEGGILTGRVVDGAGKPIRGAVVTLRFNKFVDTDIFGFLGAAMSVEEQGDSGSRAVTDGKGRFTKKFITPGTYQVHFIHPDFTELSVNDVTVFEGRDAAVDMGTVIMKAGGIITGKTLDQSGSDMPGAVVVLSRDNGFQKQAVSDKDARFRFAHLEPGKYSVTIQSDPFAGSETAQGKDLNIFQQLFAAEKSKVDVMVAEGQVQEIVVKLVR